jgi:hypothetical protein
LLRPRQSAADGGYGDPGSTAETLLAVAADGYDAAAWRRSADSPSLAAYLSGRGAAYANSSAGTAAKVAVGLATGRSCWPVGAMQPLDYYSFTIGIFGASFGGGPQAWAILGTRALSQAVPASAIDVLKSAQQADGGREWSPGWSSCFQRQNTIYGRALTRRPTYRMIGTPIPSIESTRGYIS